MEGSVLDKRFQLTGADQAVAARRCGGGRVDRGFGAGVGREQPRTVLVVPNLAVVKLGLLGSFHPLVVGHLAGAARLGVLHLAADGAKTLLLCHGPQLVSVLLRLLRIGEEGGEDFLRVVRSCELDAGGVGVREQLLICAELPHRRLDLTAHCGAV